MDCGFAINLLLMGGPPKSGTVDFLGLCSNQQSSFSPCWIEHPFGIIITPKSSNLGEIFLILWIIFYRLSFSGFAFDLSSCLGTLEIGQIPKMTVHKKLLIKKKFSTKFDDLGVIIMGKNALSSKVKKDYCWSEQSPENRLYGLFRFLWATRYKWAYKFHSWLQSIPRDMYTCRNLFHQHRCLHSDTGSSHIHRYLLGWIKILHINWQFKEAMKTTHKQTRTVNIIRFIAKRNIRHFWNFEV